MKRYLSSSIAQKKRKTTVRQRRTTPTEDESWNADAPESDTVSTQSKQDDEKVDLADELTNSQIYDVRKASTLNESFGSERSIPFSSHNLVQHTSAPFPATDACVFPLSNGLDNNQYSSTADMGDTVNQYQETSVFTLSANSASSTLSEINLTCGIESFSKSNFTNPFTDVLKFGSQDLHFAQADVVMDYVTDNYPALAKKIDKLADIGKKLFLKVVRKSNKRTYTLDLEQGFRGVLRSQQKPIPSVSDILDYTNKWQYEQYFPQVNLQSVVDNTIADDDCVKATDQYCHLSKDKQDQLKLVDIFVHIRDVIQVTSDNEPRDSLFNQRNIHGTDLTCTDSEIGHSGYETILDQGGTNDFKNRTANETDGYESRHNKIRKRNPFESQVEYISHSKCPVNQENKIFLNSADVLASNFVPDYNMEEISAATSLSPQTHESDMVDSHSIDIITQNNYMQLNQQSPYTPTTLQSSMLFHSLNNSVFSVNTPLSLNSMEMHDTSTGSSDAIPVHLQPSSQMGTTINEGTRDEYYSSAYPFVEDQQFKLELDDDSMSSTQGALFGGINPQTYALDGIGNLFDGE